MDKRRKMGKSETVVDSEALFPVAEPLSSMPSEYKDFVKNIIADVKEQRVHTFLKANFDMICMYWKIGNRVLQKQSEEGWGLR